MRIPASLLAADRTDRMLHQIGVPRHLWHSQVSEVRFKSTQVWGADFGPVSQRQMVLKYLREASRVIQKPPQVSPQFTAVVGSDPTGNGAQHLCAAIVRHLVQIRADREQQAAGNRRALELRFIDLSEWRRPTERSPREPDLVVAWNLAADDGEETLRRARDLLRCYRFSTTFLAVAGVLEVEKWCRFHLRLLPDIVLSTFDLDLGAKLIDPRKGAR
jgi:hypothetical protein